MTYWQIPFKVGDKGSDPSFYVHNELAYPFELRGKGSDPNKSVHNSSTASLSIKSSSLRPQFPLSMTYWPIHFKIGDKGSDPSLLAYSFKSRGKGSDPNSFHSFHLVNTL